MDNLLGSSHLEVCVNYSSPSILLKLTRISHVTSDARSRAHQAAPIAFALPASTTHSPQQSLLLAPLQCSKPFPPCAGIGSPQPQYAQTTTPMRTNTPGSRTGARSISGRSTITRRRRKACGRSPWILPGGECGVKTSSELAEAIETRCVL